MFSLPDRKWGSSSVRDAQVNFTTSGIGPWESRISWVPGELFWVPLEQSLLLLRLFWGLGVSPCFIHFSSVWTLKQWNSSGLTSPTLKSPFLLFDWLWQITTPIPRSSPPSIILSPDSLFPSLSCLPGFLPSTSDSMHGCWHPPPLLWWS